MCDDDTLPCDECNATSDQYCHPDCPTWGPGGAPRVYRDAYEILATDGAS